MGIMNSEWTKTDWKRVHQSILINIGLHDLEKLNGELLSNCMESAILHKLTIGRMNTSRFHIVRKRPQHKEGQFIPF